MNSKKGLLISAMACSAAIWLAGCASSKPDTASASTDSAAKPGWSVSLPQAQAQAKAENKFVVMDFTGSDWCPWCIKLDKEIFSTPEFADFASKNLVLVEVDFPRRKPQSTKLKRANRSLEEKFKVEGYPTVVVLNSEGKKVGELGYQEGGPGPFIKKLEELKKG
jgi:thioredoxin-related protein